MARSTSIREFCKSTRGVVFLTRRLRLGCGACTIGSTSDRLPGIRDCLLVLFNQVLRRLYFPEIYPPAYARSTALMRRHAAIP